jgi:hypothetical protein
MCGKRNRILLGGFAIWALMVVGFDLSGLAVSIPMASDPAPAAYQPPPPPPPPQGPRIVRSNLGRFNGGLNADFRTLETYTDNTSLRSPLRVVGLTFEFTGVIPNSTSFVMEIRRRHDSLVVARGSRFTVAVAQGTWSSWFNEVDLASGSYVFVLSVNGVDQRSHYFQIY